MNPNRVAIVRQGAFRLPFAQADRPAPISSEQVVDGFAALALDLVHPAPAEPSKKLAIERKAPVNGADGEVQVVDMSHRVVLPGSSY
jgi:hypothetical protein